MSSDRSAHRIHVDGEPAEDRAVASRPIYPASARCAITRDPSGDHAAAINPPLNQNASRATGSKEVITHVI